MSVYCIRSCRTASGSPCGPTPRAGCCCRSAADFRRVFLTFGSFSAACWDTRSALTLSACGPYSGRSQTKKRPGWRAPAVCTPRSTHSSTFWFPSVLSELHLEGSPAPPWAPERWGSYQSVRCSDVADRLSHNNSPRPANSPFPLTSIHRIPPCLSGPLRPALHQRSGRESARRPCCTAIVSQPG